MTTYDPQLLEKYAELAIKVGVNLNEGQRLLITRAPVQLAAFVRVLTRHAYQAGSRFVTVEWRDQELDRLRLEHGSSESLHEFADWRVQLRLDHIEAGDAVLVIYADDPDLMAGQDPDALNTIQKVSSEKMAPVLNLTTAGATNWSIISGSTAEWARKIYPQLSEEAAEAELWDALFEVCRVKAEDPVADWQKHLCVLGARRDSLNAKAYRELHYMAPGTDLKVGLPAGQRWMSAELQAKNGIKAVANMPTEEVWTMPHRDRVEGVVSSTKPLSHGGNIVENISLTFENGRVVKGSAEKGQTTLDSLLDIDEGARALGEVALVPHSSPISMFNLLFFNTLYDENASNHLALGKAYRYNLQGGTTMSDDSFLAAGGNNSLIHVDFMIGSEKMDVDGILQDGTVEPVMRNGEWAFDV